MTFNQWRRKNIPTWLDAAIMILIAGILATGLGLLLYGVKIASFLLILPWWFYWCYIVINEYYGYKIKRKLKDESKS
jgi:hypothetical protein